jgi:hypothetical protein
MEKEKHLNQANLGYLSKNFIMNNGKKTVELEREREREHR